MHSKHRNAIRKGEKEGLKFYKILDRRQINDYVLLLEETNKRSAFKPPSASHYIDIYDELLANGLCDWYFIKDQQKRPISGAIVTKIGGHAVYLYGASLRNIPQGAGNLLHWEIIRDLKAQGLISYDLGGVNLHAPQGSKPYLIHRFKKRFGGKLHRYYTL